MDTFQAMGRPRGQFTHQLVAELAQEKERDEESEWGLETLSFILIHDATLSEPLTTIDS